MESTAAALGSLRQLPAGPGWLPPPHRSGGPTVPGPSGLLHPLLQQGALLPPRVWGALGGGGLSPVFAVPGALPDAA